ncbi:DNA polymerase iota [Bacillus rossius redtenbacheri]|uniref:DNA polymerase iota n=1 Tax=Bacillus rossius redtenbacheri TaxID=93214 RepID=UPI002FDEC49B
MDDEFEQSFDPAVETMHPRVIVHIDIDCFYAQVEMLKNPELRSQPLGIQQKNIVVTCNYVARQFGIKKCMLLAEAKELCPSLVLVKGEDLYDYRQTSAKVTAVLQKFSPLVEKLGFDENFVDVTQLVAEKLQNGFNSSQNMEGHVYSDATERCMCGCYSRLRVGAVIAADMRAQIFEELGLTCCAGIAHNKLLAKLVCGVHKPNQQTTIFPSSVPGLMAGIESIRKIPGIGHRTGEILQSLGICSVSDLQNSSDKSLQQALGHDVVERLRKLSFGQDDSAVKPTGKPQSIGLEDGFRKISLESEVKEKCLLLLQRLMVLLAEDGRIPGAVRVTVRKYNSTNRQSHRESRQCNISPSIFRPNVNGLTPGARQKLLMSIMKLFHKMVNISKPFHLTLLGIAFTKFQERNSGKGSITSFLMNDISVQSVLDLRNVSTSAAEEMECSPAENACQDRSGSESEHEPSPKKTRSDFWRIRRKRSFTESDVDSINKVGVSELRLSSGEQIDRDVFQKLPSVIQEEVMETLVDLPQLTNRLGISESSDSDPGVCPPDVDRAVFRELPPDVQQELVQSWTSTNSSCASKSPQTNICVRTSGQNSILKYVSSTSK